MDLLSFVIYNTSEGEIRMKKILTFIIMFLLSFTILTGCSGNKQMTEERFIELAKKLEESKNYTCKVENNIISSTTIIKCVITDDYTLIQIDETVLGISRTTYYTKNEQLYKIYNSNGEWVADKETMLPNTYNIVYARFNFKPSDMQYRNKEYYNTFEENGKNYKSVLSIANERINYMKLYEDGKLSISYEYYNYDKTSIVLPEAIKYPE